MGKLEEEKKHYGELLAHIERMSETYNKHKDRPEAFVGFGVIAKEGLGSDKERTAYTQLINDIVLLYHEVKG